MKTILSRKGFDSQNGGIPSPILHENGEYKFLPLPIPFEDGIKFSEVLLLKDKTALDIINELNPNLKLKSEYCHLDPDLIKHNLLHRSNDWKPSFGQINQAQVHLSNEGISENDLFLFFGWFKFAEIVKGKINFSKEKNQEYPNGFHAIFGYLQVDKVFPVNNKNNIENWLTNHPHIKYKIKDNLDNNTIYTAKDYFTFDKSIKGAGYLKFSTNCILSAKGNKRSLWELPNYFHPQNGIILTYNPDRNWDLVKNKSILNSAKIGQEFVFKKDLKNEIQKWSINLIKNNKIGSS